MTDMRNLLLKAASCLMRHADVYVLTVQYDKSEPVCFCSNDPTYIRSRKAKLITPGEFLANSLYSTPHMIRLDAITRPTFPIEDTDALMTAFLPGMGSAQPSFAWEDTPGQMLWALADSWHLVNRYLATGNEPILTKLRNNKQQPEYVPAAERPDPVPGIDITFDHLMPRMSHGTRRSSLQVSDIYEDYRDDVLWMDRAIYEMLPVYGYHSLIIGNARCSRSGEGALEETLMMPLCATDTAVRRLMEVEMDILSRAIDTGYDFCDTPLAYYLERSDSMAKASGNWYGCPSINLSDAYSQGVYGLDLRIAEISYAQLLFRSLSYMCTITVDRHTPEIRRRLAAVHDNDALSELLTGVWNQEQQEA